MKHTLIAFAGIAALVAGLGAASAQPGPGALPMSMAAKIPTSKFLEPDELVPAQTLPAPPADGSPAQRAELAELHRIEKTRTAAQFAEAKADSDDATENVLAFAAVMGTGFQLERLPATSKLFQDLRHEDSAAAKRAKAYFQRNRPWIADRTLRTCPHADDKPKSSYPSGHATMAYATAGVLARLAPAKAPAILARANAYAENRLVCAVHYRRDIVAGQALGTALAQKLLDKPEFRAEFEAARAELTAARLIGPVSP